MSRTSVRPAAFGSVGRVGAWILLALCPLAARAAASVIVFEAEDFSTRSEVGGLSIRPFVCHAASKESAVSGLDEAGEWISFRLTIDRPVEVRDSLSSAAHEGVRRKFVVEFRDVETDRLAGSDSLLTSPGSGLGCHSAAYDWAPSTRPISLDPGEYVVRLVLLESAQTRVDRLDLHMRERSTGPREEPDPAGNDSSSGR